MKYGFISDTHDNQYNTRKACEILASRGIIEAFHLGDIVSGQPIQIMAEYPSIRWRVILGNNDGNVGGLMELAQQFKTIRVHHKEWQAIALNDTENIFITHYPALAKQAALSGLYKACFYGHDHLKNSEILDNGTLLANPGEIVGTRTGQPSLGIWDSEQNTFEIIDLEDFIVAK